MIQDQNNQSNGSDAGFNTGDTAEMITGQLESWYESLIKHLPNIAVALVVIVLAYIISRFVNSGIQKLLQNRVEQTSVRRLIGKFAAVIVVIGGIFIALNVMDLNDTVQAIIAGAGVSGLVIGLALQGTLSNVMSGIHLSFRKLVRVGDWVQTNGYEGEVMNIDLNKFVIKEADNNLVMIPNKMIIENPLKNFGLTKTMRVIINCGVGYEDDLIQVQKVAKQAIVDNFEEIETPDDVEFYYREFGDSSINFLLRFYYPVENGLQKLVNTSKAIIAIKQAFDKEGINIPFPIRTIDFSNQLEMSKVGAENKGESSQD
jgi:small conductance mechanosensitive channel